MGGEGRDKEERKDASLTDEDDCGEGNDAATTTGRGAGGLPATSGAASVFRRHDYHSYDDVMRQQRHAIGERRGEGEEEQDLPPAKATPSNLPLAWVPLETLGTGGRNCGSGKQTTVAGGP